MVNPGLSLTYFYMFFKSLLCISSSLVVAYLFCVCLSNSDFNKNEGSEAQRLKKLTQSFFEMCAVNFSSIKFITLLMNCLFLFFLPPIPVSTLVLDSSGYCRPSSTNNPWSKGVIPLDNARFRQRSLFCWRWWTRPNTLLHYTNVFGMVRNPSDEDGVAVVR